MSQSWWLRLLMSSGRDSGAEGSLQSEYALLSESPISYFPLSGAHPSSIALSNGASPHSSKINLSSSDGLRNPLHLFPAPPKRVPSRLSMATDLPTIAREEKRAFKRRASAYEEGILNYERSMPVTKDHDEDEDQEMEVERRVNRKLLLGATYRFVP